MVGKFLTCSPCSYCFSIVTQHSVLRVFKQEHKKNDVATVKKLIVDYKLTKGDIKGRSNKVCSHFVTLLLKSNSNVGHSLNKVFSQKLTQKLHITINGHINHCF